MPLYIKLIFVFVFIFSVTGIQKLEAQNDSVPVLKDSPVWLVPSPVLNKKRLALFTGTAVVAYSATLGGLNNYWYIDYPKS